MIFWRVCPIHCRINVAVEPDREKAIGLAIKSAAKDDIILIAGKGHENYQIIGKQKFDFSDRTSPKNFFRAPTVRKGSY